MERWRSRTRRAGTPAATRALLRISLGQRAQLESCWSPVSLSPCALQVILREPSEAFLSHICPRVQGTAVSTPDVCLNGAAPREQIQLLLWKCRSVLASAPVPRGPWASLCLQLKRSCFVLIVLIVCRYSITHVLTHSGGLACYVHAGLRRS